MSVIKIFVQRTFKLAIVFGMCLYAVNNFIKAAYTLSTETLI